MQTRHSALVLGWSSTSSSWAAEDRPFYICAGAFRRSVRIWLPPSELASDTLLDNVAGQSAHMAPGFREMERVVFLSKALE